MVAYIVERIDDIFNAPPYSVLVHACNCRGAWGAGVAKEFKKKFPEAFESYKDHCDAHGPDQILGTALLIRDPAYWIACLFTSQDFGKKVDPPDSILLQTQRSITDLRRQIKDVKEAKIYPVGSVWSVRINVGYFNVPWPRTLEVLQGCDLDMTIVRRPEDAAQEDHGRDHGVKVHSEPRKSRESKTSQGSRKPSEPKKPSDTKPSEPKKHSEPTESAEPKKPAQKPAQKLDKPKRKPRGPRKGIPPTDRVLRPRKPKKAVEASPDDEPKPVKRKKVVKKPAKKAKESMATNKKGTKKQAAPKPKTKMTAVDAVAAPNIDADSGKSISKRKRGEVTPASMTAKRAKR